MKKYSSELIGTAFVILLFVIFTCCLRVAHLKKELTQANEIIRNIQTEVDDIYKAECE